MLDRVATQFFKDLPYSFNRLTGFNMHRLFDTFFITMRTTPQRISLVDRDAGVILICLTFFLGGGVLCWVFVVAHRLSLVATQGLLIAVGFLVVQRRL